MRKMVFSILILVIILNVYGLNIGVSIPPEKFLVEKIAGDKVDNIIVLVQPGMSAHTFEVTPRQLMELSKADIYFSIGLEFEEALLGKIKKLNKNIKIVDLSESIQKISMVNHHHHEDGEHVHMHETKGHGHEHEGHHDHHIHGRLDPHVWNSVRNVQKMIKTITYTLCEKSPSEKDYFRNNHDKFLVLSVDLDNKIRQLLNRNLKNRSFMIFHPAWGYFARDYDLEQIPIEIEGKEPGPKDLRKILEISEKEHIKTIFVEPFFQSQSPKVIAEFIKADIDEISPLAEDWDDNMLRFAEKLRKSLEK